MIVTVLTENTSSCGLPAEHGLSLFIDTDGAKILYDTGQSGLFADNAAALGVDLREADFAVISHGHYDHGGGIARFLSINDKAPVYMNSRAFGEYFNAEGKYIGLDKGLKNNGRIILCDDAAEIKKGISVIPSSSIPITVDTGSAGLGMKLSGRIVPDDFRHEQYLCVNEGGKRIMFSACSHKGIINITESLRPDVVFGGFHFMKMPLDNMLRGYAEKLDTYDTVYYTCHCTGAEQFEYIKTFIKNLNYISAGDVIEV